jgi:hypothetical protein
MSGEPSPAAVPSSVNAAFWLYLAGALVGVVSTAVAAVLAFHRLQQGVLPGALGQGASASPEVAIATLAVALTLGIVVVGLISVAAYVVFAVLMRRGANWARIVLTVLSGIALVSGIVGLLSLNLLNLVVTVLVVIAAVLLYAPASNAYFAPRAPAGTSGTS